MYKIHNFQKFGFWIFFFKEINFHLAMNEMWSKVTFTVLWKILILNKYCSLNSIFIKESWKNYNIFHKNIKQENF